MPYQSIYRPALFAGQTIIVTGGGSGIGRCTAHELASLGAHVALVGRNAAKLLAVQAEIAEDGGSGSQQPHRCLHLMREVFIGDDVTLAARIARNECRSES